MALTGSEGIEAIDLTIVIPVYNEEESLEPLCAKLHSVLEGMDVEAEIIFVDDGSTDESFAVMERLSQQDQRIRALRFRRNYRKAVALAAGFGEARGAVVVSMDADLQDDPEELPNLLAALDQGYDLVSGWKKDRQDPLSKTLPSKLFNAVTSLVTGIRLHDFNCGLKAYRRQVTEDAIPYLYGELYRYLPAIAHWAGYRVGEIPVKHHPRRFGQSKFGSRRLLNGFLDLLTITFVVRFMTTPMHIFGSIGLLASLVGGGICAYIGLIYLEFYNIQHRHPLLLLGALLLILGIQFFSIGLLGDMLASLHHRSGKKPRVSQVIGGRDE